MLDPIPQRLELVAQQHLLACADSLAFISVLDLESTSDLLERRDDLREFRDELGRHNERAVLQGRLQCVLDPALGIEVALGLERLPEHRRLVHAHRFGIAYPSVSGDRGEVVLLDEPKPDPGVLLDLLLKVLRELLVALGRNDREGVHVGGADAFAGLVDADAQTSADGLATLAFRTHLA